MREMYYDFTNSIKDRLYKEINGRIVCEMYPEIDTAVFKVFFKDFDFSYPINNIQDRIYSGDTGEIIVDFKRSYMRTIKNAFFKTEERKKKDEAMRMGVGIE